jgi:hypothetical protein
MMPAGTRVMVAAPTFDSAFQAEVSKQFKKLFKPEEVLLRALTRDLDVQRDRLNSALRQEKPTALITISVHTAGRRSGSFPARPEYAAGTTLSKG